MSSERLSRNEVSFRYRLGLDNGTWKEFFLALDPDTLDLVNEPAATLPAWAALDFHRCPNCPLDRSVHPACPVAANIADVITFFQSSISYERADTIISTPAREYRRKASLADAISSLIGIYMVTSGCPVFRKLQPMVRFHLPFASLDETRYRVLSMYLLGQYFRSRQGKEPDWELKGLSEIYADVRVANKAFTDRLRHATLSDACVNALVKLDCFAINVSVLIDGRFLDKLGKLFSPYTE